MHLKRFIPNALFFMIMLLVGPAVMSAELICDQDYPVVDQTVLVQLKSTENIDYNMVSLLAEYRPNSATNTTREITDRVRPGVWRFTPQSAGLVQLRAIQNADSVKGRTQNILASKNISVKFNGLPGYGLLVLFTAGTILFGGIIISVAHALKFKPSDNVPTT
ncbi:hypothetical protein JXQ70_04330 [bacterium]|nr:hypothetical protein [bacterium]